MLAQLVDWGQSQGAPPITATLAASDAPDTARVIASVRWPAITARLAARDAGSGWLWDGEAFSPPPEPEPPEPDRSAMTLTFAQLMIGLVNEGWITEAEGDAWLDGTLPAPVLALISTLPEAEQFPARARAKRLIEAQRLDPLVIGLAQAESKTDAELDAFFLAYAQA